jgi:hypothetical protein
MSFRRYADEGAVAQKNGRSVTSIGFVGHRAENLGHMSGQPKRASRSKPCMLGRQSASINMMPRSEHVGMMPRSEHAGMMPRSEHAGMMPRSEHVGMMPRSEHAGMMPRSEHVGMPKRYSEDRSDEPKRSNITPHPMGGRDRLQRAFEKAERDHEEVRNRFLHKLTAEIFVAYPRMENQTFVFIATVEKMPEETMEGDPLDEEDVNAPTLAGAMVVYEAEPSGIERFRVTKAHKVSNPNRDMNDEIAEEAVTCIGRCLYAQGDYLPSADAKYYSGPAVENINASLAEVYHVLYLIRMVSHKEFQSIDEVWYPVFKEILAIQEKEKDVEWSIKILIDSFVNAYTDTMLAGIGIKLWQDNARTSHIAVGVLVSLGAVVIDMGSRKINMSGNGQDEANSIALETFMNDTFPAAILRTPAYQVLPVTDGNELCMGYRRHSCRMPPVVWVNFFSCAPQNWRSLPPEDELTLLVSKGLKLFSEGTRGPIAPIDMTTITAIYTNGLGWTPFKPKTAAVPMDSFMLTIKKRTEESEELEEMPDLEELDDIPYADEDDILEASRSAGSSPVLALGNISPAAAGADARTDTFPVSRESIFTKSLLADMNKKFYTGHRGGDMAERMHAKGGLEFHKVFLAYCHRLVLEHGLMEAYKKWGNA